MTNVTSTAGGIAWMATSALLLLAALEPVSVQKVSSAQAQVASAQAPAAEASL